MNQKLIVKIVATVVVSMSVGYFAGSGVSNAKTQANLDTTSAMSVEIEKRDNRIAALEKEISQLKERLNKATQPSRNKADKNLAEAIEGMKKIENKSKGHTFRMP